LVCQNIQSKNTQKYITIK